MALTASSKAGGRPAAFYEGKLRAAEYWFSHELPRTQHLADLLRSDDNSFASMPLDAF
jgi:butyryl-CoA dehydrogenase